MSRWKEQREAEETRQEEAEQPASLAEVEKSFEEAFNTDALLQSFMDKRHKEAGRMDDIIDTNYYFCVCFNNFNQMAEFCERFGLNADEIYMDGREVAKHFKRALREPDIEMPKTQGLNKDYISRVLDK